MINPKTSSRELLIVAAAAALLFIPFLGSVHLFDWDEINFAESAREMIVSGNYSRVQINFQPFWEKPPLFFWLQVVSMKLFGINEFAARFPNAICGMITLCLVYHLGRRYLSRSFAIWWVLFMAGSFTPHLYFKSGIIDPWFNLFIFSAVWQLVKTTLDPSKAIRHFFYLGLFSGLAFLTKGPVSLLIIGLCGLTYLVMRRFRLFFSLKLLGIALIPFVVIASLWLVPEIASNGFSVVKDFIVYQAELFTQPVAGHGQPFYYHALVLLAGCFPASWFAISGMMSRNTSQETEARHVKKWMSILFWVVLILFSLVKTKIVHYSSLCYLPLTFLAAWGLTTLSDQKSKTPKWLTIALAISGLLLMFLLTALPLIESYKDKLIPYIKDDFAVASLRIDSPWQGNEDFPGILLTICFCTGVIMLARNKAKTGAGMILVSQAVFIPIYLYMVVPKIEAYSQGPAIGFYRSLAGKDVYIESLRHKSYAQYFYAQTGPQANPNATDMNWLLKGPVDKPAYFVAKVTSEGECRQLPLKEIERKGGFIFYQRILPVKDSL